MRFDTLATVRQLGWILTLTGVFLPRTSFLELLYAVALLRLTHTVLEYFRRRPPVPRPARGLVAVVGGQVATLGTALYVTLEGLAAWLGLATPGKLIGAILLAALAGQALQVDLGFLWWSDPLAQLGAGDLARAPLLHP